MNLINDDAQAHTPTGSNLNFSKEHLEIIFEHLPVAIIILNNNLQVTSWNPKAEEITGYSYKQALGNHPGKFLEFENRAGLDILNNPESVRIQSLEVKNKFGKKRYVNYICNKLTTDKEVEDFYFIILEETTKEHEAELNLKGSEERFKNIIKKTPIGMCITDENGYFEFVNPAYCKIYNYTADELIGNHFTMVAENTTRGFLKELHDRFIQEGEHVEVRGEWEVVDKYGNKLFIIADATRIIGFDNKPKKVTFVIDVSDMKKVEGSLRQAMEIAEAANRAKSDFLANISHEIRTPLNAILGFSELLRGKKYETEKNDYYLDAVSKAAMNLLNLINDILDLSKIEAERMEINEASVDFQSICEEVLKIFTLNAAQKQISVDLDIEPDFPSALQLDETRIRQILFNLIGNAVKFTDEGGIKVSVKFDRNNDKSGDLLIIIEDSGIGIPEAQLRNIFKPFVQVKGQSSGKYGGTGLGLSITKRLLDMMNGSIKVSSKVGVGTVFELLIKSVDIAELMPKSESDIVSEEVNYLFDDRRLLIIDDNFDNAEIIDGFLKNVDLNLKHISDGVKSIDEIADWTPDLIIMKIHLPSGKGADTCELLKQDISTSSIPIIAVSSSSLEDFPISLRLKLSGFVRKPFSRKTLLNEIVKFIKPSSRKTVLETLNSGFIRLRNHLNSIDEIVLKSDAYNRLQDFIIPTWENVTNTFIINDIQQFANELSDYSSEHDIEIMKSYSALLISAVDNIDIEGLIGIVPFFSNITEKVKSSNK